MVHQNRELFFNKTCVVLFLASVTRSVAESIIAVRLGVPLPLAPVCAVHSRAGDVPELRNQVRVTVPMAVHTAGAATQFVF
jgi:hypothetical protein